MSLIPCFCLLLGPSPSLCSLSEHDVRTLMLPIELRYIVWLESLSVSLSHQHLSLLQTLSYLYKTSPIKISLSLSEHAFRTLLQPNSSLLGLHRQPRVHRPRASILRCLQP